MITGSFEKAARARGALPLVISAVIIAMGFNEWSYQHAIGTLDHGIALTDARIEAARMQQVLTEMEVAARTLLSTGSQVDRQFFDSAARELPQVQAKALALIASVDPQGLVPVDQVQQLTQAHALRLAALVDGTTAANGTALTPAPADDSRSRFIDLNQAFNTVLAQAAAIQQKVRVTLYDALQINRITGHVLLVLTLLSFYLFTQQLRRSDAQILQENHRLERQIAQRTADLRDLAGHLVEVREDERARLARELHDDLGGLLTAMKLELARLRRVADLPLPALERTKGLDARLNDGIALKRRIIENLRPSSLDQLGLKVALEMLCTDAAAMLGIPVHADLEDVEAGNKDVELSLYRTVQESLTNVAKYAKAHEVRVQLRRNEGAEGTVILTVRDDGKGFDPSGVLVGHHGLLGMRLRIETHGGSLLIESAPGRGTSVVATVPLAIAPAEEV